MKLVASVSKAYRFADAADPPKQNSPWLRSIMHVAHRAIRSAVLGALQTVANAGDRHGVA